MKKKISDMFTTVLFSLFAIALIGFVLYLNISDSRIVKNYSYKKGVDAGILKVIENPDDYEDLECYFEDKYSEEVQELVDDGTNYEDAIECFNWMQNELVFYTDKNDLYHRLTCGALEGQTIYVTFRNGSTFESLEPCYGCCGDDYGN